MKFCLLTIIDVYLLGFFRTVAPAVALVRKLTAVLESIEKLPVFSYDSSSSGYGLQVDKIILLFSLTKTIDLQLVKPLIHLGAIIVRL